MIALLRGIVAERALDRVVLDVRGVGYLVHMPAPAAAELPDDDTVTLHITTVVREDAITLFGFPSTLARDCFEILREVNGVGPRMALSILSALPPETLAQAVETDQVGVLVKVPGVGKKTASRLCLELKGKLPVAFVPGASAGVVTAPRPAKKAPEDPLVLALAQLDYRKTEIDRVLSDDSVPGPDAASIEDRIRAALRLLARSH